MRHKHALILNDDFVQFSKLIKKYLRVRRLKGTLRRMLRMRHSPMQ